MFTAESRASCSVNKTKPQLSAYKKELFRPQSHEASQSFIIWGAGSETAPFPALNRTNLHQAELKNHVE